MIDTAYDGQLLDATLSDVPERKADLVGGRCDLPVTETVKLTDMLGEEIVVTKRLD